MALQAQVRTEPRIERRESILLAGVEERYTLERRREIPLQWARFAPQIDRAPERIGGETYGAITFGGKDDGFDYLTGVRVWDASALPEGWSRLRVPARRVAVFAHPGPAATIDETLAAVHAWSRESSLALEKGPSPELMEIYGADFDPATGRGTIEVALSLAD